MTIAAFVDIQISGASDAPSATWPIMAEAAGGSQPSVPPKLQLKQADSLSIDAVPRYSLLRNGSVSFEEGSPFVERLNEILSDGRSADLQRVFGEAEPIHVRWSVRASSLLTGTTVEVLENAKRSKTAGTGTIQIAIAEGKARDGPVTITFPPEIPDDIYEVVVTANVTDSFGSSYSVDQTVWSHFLSDGKGADLVRKLLPVIATQTNVSEDRLSAGVGVTIESAEDPRIRDPNLRRSQVLFNYALQAAEDGQVTVDELTALFRGARQVTSR
jgi:hypothetical protein